MRNKIVMVVLAAIIVLGVGAAAVLFATGRLVWASSSEGAVEVDSYTAVCDTKIVDTYNDVMIYQQRSGADGLTIDEPGMKRLATTIKGLSDNQDDPTCQSILFWIAVYEKNYQNAKTAYDNVKRLHENRLFADSNLVGNQAVSTYEGAVYVLSPEGQVSEGIRD